MVSPWELAFIAGVTLSRSFARRNILAPSNRIFGKTPILLAALEKLRHVSEQSTHLARDHPTRAIYEPSEDAAIQAAVTRTTRNTSPRKSQQRKEPADTRATTSNNRRVPYRTRRGPFVLSAVGIISS